MLLVIVGVRPDGTPSWSALADGYRESKESWAALLRSLRERGLPGPVLAVGDGALGFWAALRDSVPFHQEQRCWVHKTANCTDALTKTPSPTSEIGYPGHLNAGSRTEALTAAKSFADALSGFPKATAKIMDELDTLLAFYDFPKEHWVHLRTSNPISRLSRRSASGPGSHEVLAHAGRPWPWPTSCSTPPSTVGTGSLRQSSSLSCRPAPRSSMANCKKGGH